MTYSLMTIHERHTDGTVSGSWVQDHIGTLETAHARARHVEAANSNKITIAVVDQFPSPTPALTYWRNRRPLYSV